MAAAAAEEEEAAAVAQVENPHPELPGAAAAVAGTQSPVGAIG
tara:strand:+ start:1466 stop:1594 length:129 start_codon:yes stop_codon:yes gene_type:complete